MKPQSKSLLAIFREVASEVGNPLAIVVTGVLLFNFAYAPWSINPIEDLLYVRNDGFLLPANHLSSGVVIAATAFILELRNPNKAVKTMFVIFATASIHEYVLDALNVPAMIATNSLGYTLTFRWFFWLALFLVGGLVFANRQQRKTLKVIAIFCSIYIGFWILFAEGFNIDTYTIIAYAPGPAVHDFIPNFFEVSSWIIPTSFWWFE